jgi:hypothetical protein
MIRMVQLGDIDVDLTTEQRVTVIELALKEIGQAIELASTAELTAMFAHLKTSPIKLVDGRILVPFDDPFMIGDI